MIDQLEFFKEYQVDEKVFESAGLEWKDLVNIYDDYVATRTDLEPTGNHIIDRLRQLNTVHSLRIRLKDPEHLIEKIIRKQIKNNSVDINRQNYKEKVTDLIGVRALHLFKEDWELIHDFIAKHWDFHEPPTANVRKGDPNIDKFEDKGCTIHEHEFGYRSVHYIVKSQPEKQPYLAEIQVRTIFEEGFSEIDHQIRYPYDLDNIILTYFLAIFNRLAGSADEMGSFVKILKDELRKSAHEKEQLTRKIQEQLTKLEIEKTEKEQLQENLDRLSSIKSPILVSGTFTPATFTTVPLDFTGGFIGKLPESVFSKPILSPKTFDVDEDQEPVNKNKGKQKKKPSKKDKT